MRCLECGAEMRHVVGPMTEEYRGEEFTVEGVERAYLAHPYADTWDFLGHG